MDAVRIMGVMFNSGGTATSAVHLYNATATSTDDGDIVVTCGATNLSRDIWYGDAGIRFSTGLAVKNVATPGQAVVIYKAEV